MELRIIILGLLCLGLKAQSNWLPVSDQQVIALNGYYQGGLFDEGIRLIRSPENVRLPARRIFQASSQSLYQPQEFLVNLNGLCQLDSLAIFDAEGKDSLEIWTGDPNNWQILAKIKTDRYQSWRSIPLQEKSAFLRLRFHSEQAAIGEILIYGKAAPKTKSQHRQAETSTKTLGEFIGINAFVDDPVDQLSDCASYLREYHNWTWHYQENLSYTEGRLAGLSFAPSPSGPWNFDAFYEDAQSAGMQIIACLQGNANWLGIDFEARPALNDKNPRLPESYREHSRFCFQYAARYGSKQISSERLHLAKGQPVRSGLNYLTAIENWNEPDKWWRTKEAYFGAFEFAAMLSADYDGHAGQMGADYGVKQADPDLEFIMGGLARLDTNYLEAIRIWSKYQRPKGDFPADAINFHHYSNDAGGQANKIQHAISPEEDKLYQRLRDIVRFRDRKLAQQKIYLTEFGYDSNLKSVQAAPAADSLQSLQRQANLIVRSFILAHASGIDGAFLYMFRDVNTANPQMFQSSGLSREKWNQDKLKPAFFKLRSLKRLLGDYRFVKEIPSKFVPGIYVFLYRANNGRERYVLWNANLGRTYSPTQLHFSSSSSGRVYRLKSDEGPITYTIWQAGQELAIDQSPLVLEFDQ